MSALSSRTNPAHCQLLHPGAVTQLRGKLVRLAGVEPATLGLEVRRSVRLSYRRIRYLRYTNAPGNRRVERTRNQASAPERGLLPRQVVPRLFGPICVILGASGPVVGSSWTPASPDHSSGAFFRVPGRKRQSCGLVRRGATMNRRRSGEHTSELQSLTYLVCPLLLLKKKKYEIC